MDPKEIFELIIKADEKLKYATEANVGPATGSRREPCSSRRATRREAIGNDALVQQAETRLADLRLGRGLSAPRVQSAERREEHVALRGLDLFLGQGCPVSAIVSRNSSSTVVQPSHPARCASIARRSPRAGRRRGRR